MLECIGMEHSKLNLNYHTEENHMNPTVWASPYHYLVGRTCWRSLSWSVFAGGFNLSRLLLSIYMPEPAPPSSPFQSNVYAGTTETPIPVYLTTKIQKSKHRHLPGLLPLDRDAQALPRPQREVGVRELQPPVPAGARREPEVAREGEDDALGVQQRHVLGDAARRALQKRLHRVRVPGRPPVRPPVRVERLGRLAPDQRVEMRDGRAERDLRAFGYESAADRDIFGGLAREEDGCVADDGSVGRV